VSDCYYEPDDCYYDPDYAPVAFVSRVVVARKIHRCCECRGFIQKGERYKRSSGVWPRSGPETFKTCPDCLYLSGASGCPCIPFQQLAEYLQNGGGPLWDAFRASRKSRAGGGAQ
jgi:hypothetical protein